MHPLANSEDPDEIPHNAAFHQGLHSLLRQEQSSEKEIQYFLEIITCDPQYIQWTIPSYLYQTRRKNPIVHEGIMDHSNWNG